MQKEFIHRFILNDIEHKQLFYDSKTILQEIVQSRYEESLTYELLKEEGPDHNKCFEVRALVGTAEIGRGTEGRKRGGTGGCLSEGLLELRNAVEPDKTDEEE